MESLMYMTNFAENTGIRTKDWAAKVGLRMYCRTASGHQNRQMQFNLSEQYVMHVGEKQVILQIKRGDLH